MQSVCRSASGAEEKGRRRWLLTSSRYGRSVPTSWCETMQVNFPKEDMENPNLGRDTAAGA